MSKTMENKQETNAEIGINQSNDILNALNTFFTKYISRRSDKILNDGVYVLGMAKFAGYVIGKLSVMYHDTHLNPIQEFEMFFRDYAEKSEQMFLEKQKRASEGEE